MNMKDRKGKEMHAFMQDDKTAKVFLTNEGWEVDYYNKGYFILTEPFHDKSETYAENSADNYVTGIKRIQVTLESGVVTKRLLNE